MKTIEPSYEIFYYNPDAIKLIEKIGRICYKSEDKIDEYSGKTFIRMLIKRKHEAMIEHSSISVKFIHNRGMSHELVRHRLASYAQESTRYCDYSKDKFNKEIICILPFWEDEEEIERWRSIIQQIEDFYLNSALPAQAKRGILPNDLKTEIVITANIREWRTIFKLRCDVSAHPDMRRIMIPLLHELQNNESLSVFFEDLNF